MIDYTERFSNNLRIDFEQQAKLVNNYILVNLSTEIAIMNVHIISNYACND